MPRVQTKLGIASANLDRLDGGLNIRDAPTELSASESPDCMNMSLDERGGAVSRLGLLTLNGSSLLPATPISLYYSSVADALVAYISTDAGVGKLYKSTDGGVTWSSFYTTLTAGGDGSFVDFKNRVVFVNTLDGVYSFPSDLSAPTHTAGGSNNMDAVRGAAITVWQNKLWVGGDIREDATHSKARVWWSAAGDETTWTVGTNFNDIRDVDTLPVTAIGAGMGMDVTGKPTLLVFKEGSTYRINDSTSGSYTTIHSNGAGAASARAVASVLGRICSINSRGIWVTDGIAVPQRVSEKLQPLFTADGLNLGASSLQRWCAAPNQDRLVFAVTRASGTANNLLLEYHPSVGWLVPHTMAVNAMTRYTKATSLLIGAAAASGKVYQMFKGGTDDGVSIPARFQTVWLPLSKGDEGRLRHLLAYGRGTASCQVLKDFTTVGDAYTLDFGAGSGSGFIWDVGLWDVGLWGNPAVEGSADTPLDQICRHTSLLFSNTTSTSNFKPGLLGDGVAVETGAWAVYEVKLDYLSLQT